MIEYNYLADLAVPLPEDILKEKWSGHFEKARQLIERRLTQSLPEPLRRRLKLEYENLAHIENNYLYTRDEAIKLVQERIPFFTAEKFDELHMDGKMDWVYLEGEVRYIRSFLGTLLKVYPELAGEKEQRITAEKLRLSDEELAMEDLMGRLEDGKENIAHIHIRQEISVAPEAFEKEVLRVHVPLPVERQQIHNLEILQISPEASRLPSNQDPQPTAYFEGQFSAGQVFAVEYAFDHVTRYTDLAAADFKKVSETAVPESEKIYLKEELPHIQFSPYLCALAEELADPKGNLLVTARRIYDYITTKVHYRFVRDYAAIDSIAEYCAVNQRGDCGVQSLLFITLCRICGIPARWQSGIDAKPGAVGGHDWAMFYVPSIGWVYADLSYGGSAYHKGNFRRWNYFFGNADPFRIPINSQFQRDLQPPKKFWRDDPYDNQYGEMEYADRGLYGKDICCRYIEKDIHLVK